jgi:hypothetical protein
MAAAWARYRDALEYARETLYSVDLASDRRVLDAAHYALYQVQASAFNMVIAPRQHYPRPDIHLFAEPMVYPWLLNDPDFLYRMLYLDGARTYRIWGKRHDTVWVDLQFFSRFWSEPEDQMKCLGNYDLDSFSIEPDGRFEIIASAERHAGNWISLDPRSPRHVVMIREAFLDWEKETPVEMHIETVDGKPNQRVLHDEQAMIERIDAAARLVRFTVGRFMCGPVFHWRKQFGAHSFFKASASNDSGTNPGATYWMCIYELAEDDALIVETDVPRCRYWGVQLTDVFVNTTEYVHHQSSLSGHQATLDRDGKFRAVVSKRDPGVPNWLDPVDHTQGTVYLRWYLAETEAAPTVRKVKFDEVRKYLPTETPSVAPDVRAAQLRSRRLSALRRYGY